MPILVAAQTKAWVCGRSSAGTASLNPAGVMDVSVVCCHGEVGFGLNHSSRWDLQTMVCVCVWWWSLDNEEVLNYYGLSRKEKNVIWVTGEPYKCWERWSVQIPRTNSISFESVRVIRNWWPSSFVNFKLQPLFTLDVCSSI